MDNNIFVKITSTLIWRPKSYSQKKVFSTKTCLDAK